MPHYIIGNFIGKKVTGVQRVAVEISRRLVGHPTVDFCIICRSGCEKPDWLPAEKVIELAHPSWLPSTAFQYVTVPLWLSGQQRAKEYVINFSNVGMPWFRNFIICVHDCAVHHCPAWFGWRFRLLYKTLLPLVTSVATRVTTVSCFSRKEILVHFPWTKSKVSVVSNGYDAWWGGKGEATLPVELKESPYFLVVGSLDPRKRLDLVLEAWKLLRSRHAGYDTHRLVVVGGQFKTFAGSRFEVYANDKSIHFLGYVNDELLRQLYKQASAVLNASDYEGFGLPIIEAEMAGAQVIASDIPAFREVGGIGTIFFKTGDSGDLARAIVSVGGGRLRETAPYRVDHLSNWDTAAQHYVQLVEEKTCE